MQKNKLLALIHTFSKKESKEIRKWLLSPAHNTREDVVLLYDYLWQVVAAQPTAPLAKAEAFAFVFPNETYDDAKLRQVLYFLTNVIEDYMSYQAYLQDTVRAKTLLAGTFRVRKLEAYFQQTIREAQQLQAAALYRNSDYLQNEYYLQLEQYLLLEGQKRSVQTNLQEVTNALDNTYMANKLRQACLMLSHQSVYNTVYDFGQLHDMVKYIEQRSIETLAIKVYYHVYHTFIDKANVAHYYALKALIDAHEHLFPPSEIRDIYLMAINYGIGRVNAGTQDFLPELFSWYQRGFSNGVLIEHGVVSRFTFRNGISAAIKLKEYAWVENIINTHQQYLEEKYRQSTVHYCLSKLNYEKGDYKTAMRMISQFENDDILLNLAAKTMLLKMFYEESEYDALESLLESMRSYLQRKDVIGYHKANYKNIIKYTKKLLYLQGYSATQREQVRQEIAATNPLTEKAWLLAQF